jgi:hypothetical protein
VGGLLEGAVLNFPGFCPRTIKQGEILEKMKLRDVAVFATNESTMR